eukprot:gb/GFBE01032498.1/.p1 GENE.gb/GFBE01032498.1/~~gb/GFBE01032498.1/.p1  ORF type:complete len:538 (+),score=113.51 gb/GFBE01032498.1/:1-1614(+)
MTTALFMDGMMSVIGRTSQGSLDALRKQLGPGVDPAYDYAAAKAAEKSHGPHAAASMSSPKAKGKDPSSSSGATGLDQLRRALREVVGGTGPADEQDADEANTADDEKLNKISPGVIRAQREQKRPNAAFLTTTREHINKLAVENRFRAPPVGSYRPSTHLTDPRVLGDVELKHREPTKSRTVMALEKEVMKLKAEGKPYEHLYKDIKSTEMLDEKPERMRNPIHSPNLEKYTARPDLIKSAGIHFQDNTFTDGVLDGDYNTSMFQRLPKWDFAKLSVSVQKDRETYFQPGQYKPNLDAVRTKLETKITPFEKYQARKPLKESVGRFEIDGREGDHLPDRSLSRSCPALNTRPRILCPDLDKYSERPSIIGKIKPYHNFKDPEVDKAVMDYQMTFNIMDAAMARKTPSKTADYFNRSLTRQEQMKIMRTYGEDVAMQRAKDNVTRGPVSVELLSDIGKTEFINPRILSPKLARMAGREKEHNYVMPPARQKEQKGFKFNREHRTGESLADSHSLSPIAGAISELRSSRTYDALGQTI